MGVFNQDGYIRARLDEWVTDVKNIYYRIFGTNIDLSSDTMDGGLSGAFAEALSNEDQKAEAVYKSFNPSEAEGVALSTLVQLNGITRLAATYSTVTLNITGVDTTVIPAGAVVRTSDTGEPFETDTEATISGGTATVTATAQNSGAVIALSGTLTVIDTNIAGWTSVTNNNDAIEGNDEETDESLRIRRKRSVAISSQGNVDSVYSALGDLDGVTSVSVEENRTSVTDPTTGVTAHSIGCVVQGGELDEIAETIWQQKSGGCNTYGSITETIVDSQGFNQDIDFSRPTDVDIYIDILASALDNYETGDDEAIKTAIVDYFETNDVTRQTIGEDVIYSEVYVPAMSTGNVSITSLTIGITASPTGTADITIDYDELARFDEARINVTVS
jgi:uncharacterized phage protein gp47/JayE